MLARALRRAGWTLFVLFAVVSLTFLVNHVLPGDPARVIAGPQARPADVARIRAQLGLDRPLVVQYAWFLKRLVHTGPADTGAKPPPEHASCSAFGPVHVDLGMSYQQRKPVARLVGEKLPATLMLATGAMLVQLSVGLVAGAIAARRRGTLLDNGMVTLTLIGISAPTFLSALLFQYVLAYRLRVLPFDGFGRTAFEHALHVILPSITLGVFGAAYYTRLVRDEVATQSSLAYVRTALAKGARPWTVLVKHVLRNVALPLVTVVGLDFGTLVGGAIVTEKIFRWPGLGSLSVDAVITRDGPVVMGTVIVASTAIVLANVLVDLSYAALDPRTREQ